MITTASDSPSASSWSMHYLAIAFIVGTTVFAASLFGILTRPLGFLAALWPANAILLGLMVRNPSFAGAWGWIWAFIGYLAADLVTGGELKITLWLTIANMSGAITGYLLFSLLPETDRHLGRPLSVLNLLAVCIAAAAVAAAIGGGAARLLFARDFLTGLEFWFVTELVNMLIILPVIITLPSSRTAWKFALQPREYYTLRAAAPILTLIAALAAGAWVGGPGAIAFAVPALLFCALSYSMFTVAVLTMFACGWMLISISAGITQLQISGDPLLTTSSLRLGIALIALAPLTAASIDSARRQLLEKLGYAASRDGLTGAINRQTFFDGAARLLGDPAAGVRRQVGFLMLDIDNFKKINDTHGHATGDAVLKAFARIVSNTLRDADLFGRIGGEEFAVALPGVDAVQAAAVAERIRLKVEASVNEFAGVTVTVSTGVTSSDLHPEHNIDALMALADRALYTAKFKGRNRVESA